VPLPRPRTAASCWTDCSSGTGRRWERCASASTWPTSEWWSTCAFSKRRGSWSPQVAAGDGAAAAHAAV